MAGNATIAKTEALLEARRFAEAARLLKAAAEAGEPTALSRLAHWRIAGDIVRRDLAAARKLLAQAATAGDAAAARLHAYFLASATGGVEDLAGAMAELRALRPSVPDLAEQVRLVEATGIAAPAPQLQLSDQPHVTVAKGFLAPELCAYLSRVAEPLFQPSVVVDPDTGRMVPNPIRVSDGAFFGVYTEDLVVNAINRRIAQLSGTDYAQGEPLQVLRYRPGGEYRAHMDALGGEPNQRILTVLVYLSEDYEGGETRFLRTGLSFKGRIGDALLFRNVTPDGRADPKSLHAGLPVRSGTKMIASRWIRQRPFTFPSPRPILEDFG
jgi:prolyl 4-hydroxylase